MQACLTPAEAHGPVLAGRALAAELRNKIEAEADQREVLVDLGGVETVSPSFADELFGKLQPGLVDRGQVRFVNVHPDVSAIIRTATAGRAVNGNHAD